MFCNFPSGALLTCHSAFPRVGANVGFQVLGKNSVRLSPIRAIHLTLVFVIEESNAGGYCRYIKGATVSEP